MLQLRTNGCPDCLNSARKILRELGMYSPQNYTTELHKEHRNDNIYKVRPDYLRIFSGAILYNPTTEHWIDFYDNDHIKLVLNNNDETRRLIKDLEAGK